ncbi:MAG: TetR/AcrR family transcriptional regulator [Spirochaetaceae bacterium]|nr:MAG: TetR/AcrR family transcriptional regulator [Spirochaetaceae bacterium]
MRTRQRVESVKTTKQKILQEAEKLFAVKGFEGTGIEEIARKVGIRKSVIYYHFKNKEQILETMLEEFVTRGVAFKKSFFERYAGNFMEKLDVIMEEMIAFMEENRRILTILLMESIKNPRQVPLLELWNFQSPAAREVVASAQAHHIDTVKAFDRNQSMHEAFFMLSLPLVGYTVFSEKWCERYGFDREQSRKLFVDGFLWYFRERLLKRSE